MILTIVVPDNLVIIDGNAVNNIDLSSLPPEIHAIQWNGNKSIGEIEYSDDDGVIIENSKIYSISDYQHIIDDYYIKFEEMNIEDIPDPMDIFRSIRNQKLSDTDYIFIKASESGSVMSDDWILYRQALRDLPLKIETGELAAPTLDENGMLIFNDWPNEPELKNE